MPTVASALDPRKTFAPIRLQFVRTSIFTVLLRILVIVNLGQAHNKSEALWYS